MEYSTQQLTFEHQVHIQIHSCLELNSRKIKGGICCGSYLTVTYGGELLYFQIFL